MILSQAIAKVKEEKPNTFSDEKLVGYVNEIEAEVAEQLNKAFTPYVSPTDLSKTLLAADPYSRLYVSYLKASIDFTLEEMDVYANDQAQHIQDFRDFVDWVIREDKADHPDGEVVITRLMNTF